MASGITSFLGSLTMEIKVWNLVLHSFTKMPLLCQNGLPLGFPKGISCGFMACILFIGNAWLAPQPKLLSQHCSTSSLLEVSEQDLSMRSLWIETVWKSPLGKISARYLLASSQHICMQCPCVRSLKLTIKEVSWQDLCRRPLGKISVYTTSL